MLAARAASTGLPYRLGADPPEDELSPLWDRFAHASTEEAAIIANREIFGRLNTAAMLPTMRSAVADWRRPRLVLREPSEYASAVVAEEAGLARIQVAIPCRRRGVSVDARRTRPHPYQPDLAQRLLDAPYVTRFPESLTRPRFGRHTASARRTTYKQTGCRTGGTATTRRWCISPSEPSPPACPPRLRLTARHLRRWTASRCASFSRPGLHGP